MTAFQIVVLVLVTFFLTPAYGAVKCGDPDANELVTISDGVQVLRAAVGLSSGCDQAPSLCDVDGNAGTSVTDGVRVLREAAGLDDGNQCDVGSGESERLANNTFPFGDDILKTPGVGKDEAPTCENVEGRVQIGETVIVFTQCVRGGFQRDGAIAIAAGENLTNISVEGFALTNLMTRNTHSFTGTLVAGRGADTTPVDGAVAVSSTEFGAATLSFDVQVDQNDEVVGGLLRVETAEDSTSVVDNVTVTYDAEIPTVSALLRVPDTTARFGTLPKRSFTPTLKLIPR